MRERARLCRTQAATSQQREARQALLEKAAEWEAWAGEQSRVEAQAAKLREQDVGRVLEAVHRSWKTAYEQ